MSDSSYAERGVLTSTFLLEVDDVEIGRFSQVSGLQVEVQVETYQEGGENGFVHKLPGQMTWPDLTFRGGLTQSDALFDWMRKSAGEGFEATGNKLKRSTAAITMLDQTGKRLRSWSIEDAFPIRWNGPELTIDSNADAQEELVVAHHGFRARDVNS